MFAISDDFQQVLANIELIPNDVWCRLYDVMIFWYSLDVLYSSQMLQAIKRPGAVAWSEASSLGMQADPSSIPTSGTFFRGDLVMKTFLRLFSLFRWFKKSSCQLVAKECALSTGKLSRRPAQGQCG